jgi:macrolide transport system ATP-binding/permease protein
MILSGENGIKLSPAARIGYFSQSFDILDENRTVLENVMEGSEYPESFVRTVLARLLFKRDDVYKKVGVLSGGERVKASFARMFVSGTNMLILDEPTNFLDIYSEEALENVLKDYDGTLLFVSHDRRFIREIADTIITIEDGRITQYRCGYDEYLRACSGETFKENVNYKERLMLLENKLTGITSRISTTKSDKDKESLDKEYYKVLDEIRMVKSSIISKEDMFEIETEGLRSEKAGV